MSGEKLSADLAKQVRERTGQEDVEQGVWHLIYLSRGRHEIDAGQ